eukprot:11596217-Prorocentrum_lima.AAC.1
MVPLTPSPLQGSTARPEGQVWTPEFREEEEDWEEEAKEQEEEAAMMHCQKNEGIPDQCREESGWRCSYR